MSIYLFVLFHGAIKFLKYMNICSWQKLISKFFRNDASKYSFFRWDNRNENRMSRKKTTFFCRAPLAWEKLLLFWLLWYLLRRVAAFIKLVFLGKPFWNAFGWSFYLPIQDSVTIIIKLSKIFLLEAYYRR